MKALKTLSLFAFSILVTSCFDSPEFEDVPHIEYRSIYFGPSDDPALMDSLVVELAFEDGNGDLGLDNSPTYRNEPFHELDYFLTDGATLTTPVREVYNETGRAFLGVPEGATGKLARLGDLGSLPPDNCDDYRLTKVNILVEDAAIIDDTYQKVENKDPKYPNHYEVTGKFYVVPNENNKNITVRFFYTSATQPNPEDFTEYKWTCQNFDGRFEVLSDKETALSGTIRYTMPSFGFASVMSEKNWQLRFTIRDRARNVSNEVSSQLFTLKGITRN